MAGTGNIELKLAINHLRLWLIHNNIPYEQLELTIKVPHQAHQMQDAFQAMLEPEDRDGGAGFKLSGVKLHFTTV